MSTPEASRESWRTYWRSPAAGWHATADLGGVSFGEVKGDAPTGLDAGGVRKVANLLIDCEILSVASSLSGRLSPETAVAGGN